MALGFQIVRLVLLQFHSLILKSHPCHKRTVFPLKILWKPTLQSCTKPYTFLQMTAEKIGDKTVYCPTLTFLVLSIHISPFLNFSVQMPTFYILLCPRMKLSPNSFIVLCNSITRINKKKCVFIFTCPTIFQKEEQAASTNS